MVLSHSLAVVVGGIIALAVGFSWEVALVLFGILSVSSSDSDDSDALNI